MTRRGLRYNHGFYTGKVETKSRLKLTVVTIEYFDNKVEFFCARRGRRTFIVTAEEAGVGNVDARSSHERRKVVSSSLHE